MKKYIITLAIALATQLCFAQDNVNNPFRIKQIDKSITNDLLRIDGKTYSLINTIEQRLDQYKNGSEIKKLDDDFKIIRQIDNNLNIEKPKVFDNWNLSKKDLKTWFEKWGDIQKSICSLCYENELNAYITQQEYNKEQKKIIQQKADSINKIKSDSILAAKQSSRVEQIDTSYDARMIRFMFAFGKDNNRFFTTFCGVRFNFAVNKLSMYLQEYMRLTDSDFKRTGNKLSITYIPRVSSSKTKEYITTTYTVSKNKYNNDDDKEIITRCDITGTSDILVTLFINYWAKMVKIDDSKTGEVVFYEYLGDRVSLMRSQNSYRIEIKPSGNTLDYEMIGK